MNKTELKNFAVNVRRDLLKLIALRANLFGIGENIGLTIEEEFGQLVINERTYPTYMKSAFRSLQKQLDQKGYEQVLEEVAYTWFNRIISIRYMEIHDYLPERVNVLSSSSGRVDPDILMEFESMELPVDKKAVKELLDNGDTEGAYRKLFTSQCNVLYEILPFMFEKIQDYTELLLPDFLLDRDSVINVLVKNKELTKSFEDVEVIGWLYQFYNTDPKDKVFANLKKNKKIEKYDIPAATQLFTPKWIVQYMVENSLGQLWIEANPNSPIKEKMKYYIEPALQDEEAKQKLEEIRYKNVNLEEITIIDPCVGSGHMLVYTFDLLYEMYEETGYPSREIPKLILEKNLYGLDIDERATQLASFALMMKGRKIDKRFFKQSVNLNILNIEESNSIRNLDLKDLFSESPTLNDDINELKKNYINAKNFGSILPNTNFNPLKYMEQFNNTIDIQLDFNSISAYLHSSEVFSLLKQSLILNKKYDIVITNPPYMGSNGMNATLSKYLRDNFPNSKSDLSTVMMERALSFAKNHGYISMINIPTWMFITSYEKFRNHLIQETYFLNMVHLGRGVFGSDFGSVAFVVRKCQLENYLGSFKRLFDQIGSVDSIDRKEKMFSEPGRDFLYKQNNFNLIKGRPIAYWLTEAHKSIFTQPLLGEFCITREGLTTGDNEKFLRLWHEVPIAKISFNSNKNKFYPLMKGGPFRKWYGNLNYVVNWENNGFEVQNNKDSNGRIRSHNYNLDYILKPGITWTRISSSDNVSFRIMEEGFLFDSTGASLFLKENELSFNYLLGLLNSKVSKNLIPIINPTIALQVGSVAKIPFILKQQKEVETLVNELINIAKDDWNSSEISRDFKKQPLLVASTGYLKEAFNRVSKIKSDEFVRLKFNEEELNKIFIGIYGLQNELSPEVENKDIKISKVDSSYSTRSLLSYFIGCSVGRYSLDIEGLAYAGGEWNDSMYKSYKPNKYSVIQFTDAEYFEHDIIARLHEFLAMAFSPDTIDENIQWLAESLGMKKGEDTETRLRRYFTDEFFADHCKMYQKCPIYWLVDSGNQKGLRTLIYMHRYQPDTMATIRYEHLQEIQAKYNNEIDALDMRIVNPNLSATEKRNLDKQKEVFKKRLEELLDFDKKLAEYANAQIEINLDDGVKFNYAKFDKVLAKVK